MQALKALGKNGVTPEVIMRLRLAVSDRERKALLNETSHVTFWIYDVVKRIMKEVDNA